MLYDRPYVPPNLTVDLILFQFSNDKLEVLLTKRANEPFKDWWALPGGYCAVGSTTQEALSVIIKVKTGIKTDKQLTFQEQFYTFDTVARDPRGHAVSVTYSGYSVGVEPSGGRQAASFFPISEIPELAFDHADIIKLAYERLASKIMYSNIVAFLLPKKFTFAQLQKAYETILERPLDKRNFRKKYNQLGLIHKTNEMWREGKHRPARLYSFNDTKLKVFSNTQL
jgi:8-oxo-dGTP diphosphatase